MVAHVQNFTERCETVLNIGHSFRPLTRGNLTHVIKTDASLAGWSAFYDHVSTEGQWSLSEQQYSINYLEMKAILFALQTISKTWENTHIKIMSDNTTAVSVLNNMGTSHSTSCNQICKEIWEWCIKRDIWLTLAHIPGKDNVEADSASRKKINYSTEWKLDSNVLRSCLQHFNLSPNIDLFATRLNAQFPCFISFKPDPGAMAVDAFTLDWAKYQFYAFPPFSIISKVLQKVMSDKAEGICVFPQWPTLPWYPQAKKLVCRDPIILTSQRSLHLPNHLEEIHPLAPKLRLIVCHLSSKN